MQNDGQEMNQSATPVDETTAPAANEGELLASIRERALSTLTATLPTLKNIDPEQKFLISMSALRSTDNIALLEPALQAAQAIEDKEVQANSLLDLINEVNYLIDSRKPASNESDSER